MTSPIITRNWLDWIAGLLSAISEPALKNTKENSFFLSKRKIFPVRIKGQKSRSETDFELKTDLQFLLNHIRGAFPASANQQLHLGSILLLATDNSFPNGQYQDPVFKFYSTKISSTTSTVYQQKPHPPSAIRHLIIQIRQHPDLRIRPPDMMTQRWQTPIGEKAAMKIDQEGKMTIKHLCSQGLSSSM